MTPKIAVLALQGAFIEHVRMFESLGADVFEIRQYKDLEYSCDALVLPGGESTVQSKLMHELDIFNMIKQRIVNGMPVMATCAGLILLAEKLQDDPAVHLATLPVTVQRNAYGRQLGSFHITGNFDGYSDVPMPFIRAPKISAVGNGVKVLSYCGNDPTAVLYEKQLAMTWHPEITRDNRVHKFFLDLINK